MLTEWLSIDNVLNKTRYTNTGGRNVYHRRVVYTVIVGVGIVLKKKSQ